MGPRQSHEDDMIDSATETGRRAFLGLEISGVSRIAMALL